MDAILPGMAAAGLYIGLLTLMNIVLQARVIQLRRGRRIGLGDGGDKDLARAVRVHGNFAENAPFAFAGLVALAALQTSVLVIHAVGLVMLAGRVLHAVGLSQSAGSTFGRVAGMVLTFTALGATALLLIARGLAGFGG
jgi:uncharacterized membrane protein YecN with MAPEG domain